jgi:hypothetical protein
MLVGHVDLAAHHCVAGWAADTDDPQERIELSILVDGEECGRVIADEMRPDLQKLEAMGDGKHGFRYFFDRPLTLTQTYNVVIRCARTGQSLPKGEFYLTKRPIRAKDELWPILVTSSGRSGSTLLMRRLGNDPQIVMADQFPFEMKLTTYYSKAFDVLTSPGNRERSVDPDHIYDDPYHLGLNPFHHHYFSAAFAGRETLFEFFRDVSAPIVAFSFKEIITAFYSKLAAFHGKREARFFAEKSSIFDPIRNFVRSIYDEAKEIVLVRDPRDTYCSYKSFWSAPGDQAMRTMRTFQAQVKQIRSLGDSNVLICRYEDMLADDGAALQQIAAFLGLGRAIRIDPDAEAKIFTGHGTSQSPEASIGRWRRELSVAEIMAIDAEFGGLMDMFGYER